MLNLTSARSLQRVESRPLPALLAADVAVTEPVALIVAHPDDEVLGLGARLHRLRDWRLTHLSDGAPRDMRDARRAGFAARAAYAHARRHELDAALSVLGATPRSQRAYGCADQEVVMHLLSLIQQLCDDLGEVAYVITHAYEHGHPDHDAAALCVHAACALRRRRCLHVPQIMEFAGYHQHGAEPVFGQFWRDPLRDEHTATLASAERERKARALACFRSQGDFIARFPLERERYRLAPAYDFAHPAPPGLALYESFGFAIDRVQWHEHATFALQEFDLRGAF